MMRFPWVKPDEKPEPEQKEFGGILDAGKIDYAGAAVLVECAKAAAAAFAQKHRELTGK